MNALALAILVKLEIAQDVPAKIATAMVAPVITAPVKVS